MFESILTLAVVGFIAGIFFSMPIAGPISIIIVSRAFEGKLRYCTRIAIGSTIVEFFYVFIVVYGINALFRFYQPVIPYLIFVGALFVIYAGIKIFRRKITLDEFNATKVITDKLENRGGMRTGIILNLTNPTLFIGWLVASFITLSFVSSMGLKTGGLDLILNKNVSSVSEIAGSEFKNLDQLNHKSQTPDEKPAERGGNISSIVFSLVFSLFVAAGALFWLDQLARFIIKHRDKIKVEIINKLIQFLGSVLVLIGGYLGYQAISIFIG
jgi:threonine/homoserine/homoserine lactone efflux protein